MTITETGIIPTFTLADRLRKARELTGLDQAPFAELAGVSRTTVSNAEQPGHRTSRLVIRAWATASGVSLDWLATGYEQYTPRDSNPEPAVLSDYRSDQRRWVLAA